MATKNPFAGYKEKRGESPASERKEPKGLQRHENVKGMEKHRPGKKKPC
jgi:hypothetical protein